jgi:hypothetical protein
MYERTYHKTVLKTDEKTPGKRRSHVRINWRLVALLVGIVVVLTGIVIIIRLQKVQVKTITVTGANVVDPADVSEFVKNQLQGNDLWLLPRTSIFIIPEGKLEREIKTNFPRLQTVAVSRQGFSKLTIAVTEYQGIYLWCTDDAHCDFMDQNGVVFSSAPYFSGNAYPKIFIGNTQSLPFQALDANQLNDVNLLVERLPIINVVPQEFHFVTAHELDVDFNHDGHPAQLLFDPTFDINDSLEALYTGLRTDPLMTKFNDASQVLQYIDLRFQDRVVYKFQ